MLYPSNVREHNFYFNTYHVPNIFVIMLVKLESSNVPLCGSRTERFGGERQILFSKYK